MGTAHAKSFGPEAIGVLTKESAKLEHSSSLKSTATFAAGCFWGVQLAFQRVPGVDHTEVGYTQGHKPNPTYEEVCSGQTGHTEAIKIEFNPEVVSYSELLTILWDRMDPTTVNRQGNDVGTQYRSGIYYHSEEQKKEAIESRDKEQEKYSDPIVTEILPAKEWYPAEEYHQRYLEKGGQCARKGDTSGIAVMGDVPAEVHSEFYLV
eukprot:CAMPEP_0185021544 /NCGR_PEP_ID=MMETSP1103-20130426/4233_1 /TAXON_ID=36769 /ORGANISM="Paraphysomonas bandaiensis, Strain Caron Lab Isolate" /LENGTH=206 /DNA_ID=CAMNT_0027553127 /DNA_START=85 /DNA_END=706 /DNA_ORIENTATION=-